MDQVVHIRVRVQEAHLGQKGTVGSEEALGPLGRRALVMVVVAVVLVMVRPVGTLVGRAQARRAVRQAVQVVAVVLAKLEEPPGGFRIWRVFAVSLARVRFLQIGRKGQDNSKTKKPQKCPSLTK